MNTEVHTAGHDIQVLHQPGNPAMLLNILLKIKTTPCDGHWPKYRLHLLSFEADICRKLIGHSDCHCILIHRATSRKCLQLQCYKIQEHKKQLGLSNLSPSSV